MEFNNTYEYEDRIIAFIDILGFRAFVNDTIDKKNKVNKDKLSNLINSLLLIKEEFQSPQENSELSSSFIITYFSDSIVFSVKPTAINDLIEVFEILKRTQLRLIEKGILLRGGIVQGNVIHTSQMIIGPAMMSAYDLESKSALYPRITIDPKIIYELFDENGHSLSDHEFRKTFMIDFDNTYYVDYFTDAGFYNKDEKTYYSNLRNLIRNGVRRSDIGIRMKYLWMLNKFNNGKPSYIRAMKYNGDDDIKNELGFTRMQ